MAYGYKRRLPVRSAVNLSTARTREPITWEHISLLWTSVSSFITHVLKRVQQHTCPPRACCKEGILSPSKSENVCIPYLPPGDLPFAFDIKSSQGFILKENLVNFCESQPVFPKLVSPWNPLFI